MRLSLRRAGEQVAISGRVRFAWLIDPIARTLEVLKLEGDRWTIMATHADNEVVRAQPFTETEIELATLWTDEDDRS